MARKPGQKPSVGSTSSGKARKEKNKTDPKTPQQRVRHMGPSGKLTLVWRDWD
jgi:hypothetical protein